MELDKNDVKQIFKSLGSIETGVDNLNSRMDALPCKTHTAALQTRVSWKQMWAIVITCAGLFFGALGLHYDLTRSHADDKDIHRIYTIEEDDR
jgi:hypothetical protein